MAGDFVERHGNRLPWKPSPAIPILLIVYFTLGSGEASCILLNRNGTGADMHFTSRDSGKHHVTSQGYQTIACRAVNFCRVRWYRLPEDPESVGGRRLPYPWDLGEFTVFLLRDDNQELVFRAADEAAQGIYECDVSNGTHNITRRTQLTVDEKYWWGNPLQLQHPLCHNATAAPGDNATLLCRFYVGALLDFTSVYWRRPNASVPAERRSSCGDGPSTDWLLVSQLQEISLHTSYRATYIQADADSLILANSSDTTPWVGSKLDIINVSEEAYGIYCVIANNGGHWSRDILMLSPPEAEPQPTNHPALAVAVVVSSVVFVVIVFVTWKVVALDAKLWYQGRFGNTEENDGKLYDAYVSYSWSDSDRQFILRILMPYLEKYGYKLFVPEIHTVPSNVFLEELNRAMEDSRRCIMLITPSYLASELGRFEVELAADIMSCKLSERIVPVLLGVSPLSDASPLYGSEPSLSSAASSSSSSTPPSSQPSSLSSESGSQSGTSADSISSCSSKGPSKLVRIDFNSSPLLGQLVKVLKPLRASGDEPHRAGGHSRFLKRLRLRMPRPPAGNGLPARPRPLDDVVMETVSQTGDLVDHEVLPDGRGEDADIRMQTFPRLYPVVPDGDTQNRVAYPVVPSGDPASDTSMSWNPLEVHQI